MQMGGGDSLYDKIDKGVRGCDVMLSCVTSKYSKSANCRREVSLADAIKKPIIPLLLEKMTWPPEGPMAMVFTQLLYINFCKPKEDIQNHWKCEQFEELQKKMDGYLHVEDKVPTPDRTHQNVDKTKATSSAERSVQSQEPTQLQGPPQPKIAAQTQSESLTRPKSPEIVAPKSSCCVLM